jgi:hypothetical protein
VGPTCQRLASAWRTPLGAGGLLGWASFLAWASWLARGPLLFFLFKTISFSVFETKGFVLQQILHIFESLQICNICIMARGFLY